ncbi:hypothetical protein [Dictyobacter arantiisoli]|uniref:Uncharacterized protein n=1 Tax=Dictyobacter arantiisoli TaxID=2014874 RepID=A0A5A5TE20_9CHLR|nr:hypothetical protein [Dictyobacter arantiisoli]GCF09144.1 hypothetical protein KDI_27080 [Dictyobacter arantiisoli]
MANQVFLVVNDSANPILDEIDKNEKALLACNYSIPLFWFTLYSPNDVFLMDVEMDDAPIEQVPTLVVDLPTGIERAEERANNVFHILPHSYTDLYQQWLRFLKGLAPHPALPPKYVHIDLTELWMMSDDTEQFTKDLRMAVSAVDRTDRALWDVLIEEFVGIVMRSGFFSKEKKITYPKTVDGIQSLLTGYDWYGTFREK